MLHFVSLSTCSVVMAATTYKQSEFVIQKKDPFARNISFSSRRIRNPMIRLNSGTMLRL